LFPALEQLLEVEDWLTDICDVVHAEDDDDPEHLASIAEPGSLLRLTADGTLFDAEYFARILG
jgi:hypothetical protein